LIVSFVATSVSTFNFFFLSCSRLLNLVESGIIKYKLKEGLPNAEICPQNLVGTDRQLQNKDLATTYLVMLTGFCTSSVVFVTEVFKNSLSYLHGSSFNMFHSQLIFRYLNQRNKQKNKIADSQNPRLANSHGQSMKMMLNKQVSPPPPYTTLYNRFNETKPTKNAYKDGVRQVINGRDYMVVKEMDGSSKLIPMRTPSAALFQYSYTQ
jgi:glutamate receptor, ionotropic, invertebrate